MKNCDKLLVNILVAHGDCCLHCEAGCCSHSVQKRATSFVCSQSWMRCGQGAPQEQLSVRSLDTFFAQSGLYRLRDATPPSNVRFNRCFCGDVSGMSSRAQCVQERAWWRRVWVRHVSLALVGSFHCPGSSTVLLDEVATLVARCSSEFAVDLNISRTLMVHSALIFRRLQSYTM